MCIFDEGGMVGLVHEEGQSMRKDSPCSKLCIYLDGQRTGLIYFVPVPFDFNRTKEFKGAEKEMQYRCAIERQKHTHILCAYLGTLTSVDYFKASNQFHNKA